MSELIQKNDNRATIRWKLLASASALTLIGYVSLAGMARADDTDRPQLWIELGGQLSQLEDSQAIFSPAFLADRPSIFKPSQPFETPSRFSIDEFGALSFQPDNSEWIFSASIRYGRSQSRHNLHQQTDPSKLVKYYYGYNNGATNVLKSHVESKVAAKFADTAIEFSERHDVLDFQVGKDVGLGMFGAANGSATLNAGIRFAQFGSKSNIALKSDPDAHALYKYFSSLKTAHGAKVKTITGGIYHSNAAILTATRSFRGIGPSLSWNASTPFAGNLKDGELDIDWGVNAALLFGRQRAKVHHQTTARYHHGKYPGSQGPISRFRTTLYRLPATHTRSRNVTVPNVGGFAGLSFKYSDAKVSLGYRADFFFGAMDGGIDTAKKENVGFFGPFASVSIGVGD